MALVRGAPQLLVETDINGGLGYENRLGRTVALADRALNIPGFTPRVLASLVASSTAACTSGVVTVTATAHGIPATSFDGYSFYYPGSPSLAAAWYTGFSRTGADTVTFSAPSSANFTSESVNGGAVLTTEVTVSSVVIPGGSILPGNIVSCRTARIADALTGSRILILRINGTQINRYNVSSTTINGTFLLSFCAPSLTTQEGFSVPDGLLHATKYNSTVDLSQDVTLSVTHSLSIASQYVGIISLSLRIE